jgi:hypothetical protein
MRLINWEQLIRNMSAEGVDTNQTYAQAKLHGLEEKDAMLASIIMNGTGNLLIRTLKGILEDDPPYLQEPFACAMAYMTLASMSTGKEASDYRLRALESAEMLPRGSSDRSVLISWITCMRYRHHDVRARSNTWIRYNEHLPDLLNTGQRDAVSLALYFVDQRLRLKQREATWDAKSTLAAVTERVQNGSLSPTPQESLEIDRLQEVIRAFHPI